MAVARDQLLLKYASAFRKIINQKVRSNERSIRELLKLDRDGDWEFLTAAMDILEDSSAAISHVRQYGLSGITKIEDVGERYLRLYGLLSAAYIQQQSAITIYRTMKFSNPKDLRNKFEMLDIRQARHKLSSHGTDYKDRVTGAVQVFVPVRIELRDRSIEYVGQTATRYKLDLTTAIDAHLEMMTETMDEIVAGSINKLFDAKSKMALELNEDLADLRIEKGGGMVFQALTGGPKVIITVAGASDE